MKKMNFKSESGFTLMELMVVVGVLAILIAILLPQFSGYTAQAQAISAASQTKNALTAGYSYWVSATSRSSDGTIDDNTLFTRMSQAVKDDGKIDSVDCDSNATGQTIADPSQIEYQVQKGNLTFTAVLDVTTGSITGGSDSSTSELNGFACTGDVNVCEDLKNEGALQIQ